MSNWCVAPNTTRYVIYSSKRGWLFYLVIHVQSECTMFQCLKKKHNKETQRQKLRKKRCGNLLYIKLRQNKFWYISPNMRVIMNYVCYIILHYIFIQLQI